jgi:hypothetical protein
MKELNNSRLKIMERLRDTIKDANNWKDEVEENSYLWLDDRKEHMRQFLLYGRSLEGKIFFFRLNIILMLILNRI